MQYNNNRIRDKYKQHYSHISQHQHHEHDPKYPTFSHLKTDHQDPLMGGAFREEKMSTLRRACLVDKWMEKKVSEKIITKNPKPPHKTTLLDQFDVQDTLFYSKTTTETEYSVFLQPKQKQQTRPSIPKPVTTRPVKDHDFIKSRSRAQKIYSNLKSLKQPVSPGARLTGFLSSLFAKEGKKEKPRSEQASSCSSASSFTRSCLTSKRNDKYPDAVKRTVRFCPVNAIIDDSNGDDCGVTKKRERARVVMDEQKKLEQVALDLLNGYCYWDDEKVKEKANYDDGYGDNHGVNYDQDDVDEDEDDDGLSCSSSDLFELDIGNELPVYETTRLDPKIL